MAQTNIAGALLLILGGLLAAVSVVGLYLRGRARGRALEIPPAMSPGPSDGALETPLLHKLQGWGVVLVAFFVVWFPATWLIEPSTNLDQEERLLVESVERGSRSVLPFSEANQIGVGCVSCHGPELRGQVIRAQGGFTQSANLTTLCGGPNTGHPNIVRVQDIYEVIRQGRGAMPSWSIRYQGALLDQQIQDLVNYLIDMSSKNVPFEQNICLNEKAAKAALDEAKASGVVLEAP